MRSFNIYKIVFFSVLFLIIFSIKSNAQNCPNCPQVIGVFDTTRCQNGVVLESAKNYTNVSQTDAHYFKVCKNTLMKYVITDYSGCNYNIQPTNFVVTGGTFISSNLNTFTIQWGNSNNGLVKFTLHNANPQYVCDTTVSIFFDLQNTPVAAFSTTPQPACFNNPTTINFNSNASVNATDYYWDFGDGFTAVGPNPSHNYSAPGNYQVCLYVSSALKDTTSGSLGPSCPTCVDSVCNTVVIDALPSPPIKCIATICAGKTATYSTSVTGCSSYVWSVVGGTIMSGQGTNAVQIQWGNGIPQGSISLVTTGCTSPYCTQGNTVSVPIIANAYPISGDTLVCVGTTQTYTLPVLPATTYNWSINSPATLNPFNTNSSSVSVIFYTNGTYTLTASYFDTTLNCGGDTSLVIYVRPELLIKGKNVFCAGSTSILNSYFLSPANAQIPHNANWTISPNIGASIIGGNGTPNANFSWTSAGTYTITATTTSSAPPNMCNVATYEVTVNPLPVIDTIIGSSIICPNSAMVYSASSTSNGIYTWTVLGGSFVGLNGNNDSVQINWNNFGPYGISVSLLSFGDSCTSVSKIKNVSPYPAPTLSGNVQACVDDTLTYTVTGISSGVFNWSISPSNLGTVISGQGTSVAQIKWHGDNTLSNPLFAYLYYGVCSNDSIMITINKPPVITISATGTLCTGGITLSNSATSGNYLWSAVGQPVLPTQSLTLATISGLYNPGNYAVNIQNVNNTGCDVSATYNIPDAGRPDAQIFTTGSTYYCLPALPNFTINALTGAGYNYQWYMNGGAVGTNSSSLLVNNVLINSAGVYSFVCVVTVGLCKDTSSAITVNVTTCTSTGCLGTFDITNISNCNPFTLTLNPTFPLGATLSNEVITHYDDNSTIAGLTTKNYTTIGLKQFKICALVTGPGVNCVYCKDTFATVSLASLFLTNNNCGVITLTDQSTVIPPATITAYGWSVTDGSNNAVPPIVASFNNPAIASPVLTITQSGTYIITQTVTASNGCISKFKDTIIVDLADASFIASDTCENKTVAINNVAPATTHYWDFGDASTSFSNPTAHAYANFGTYIITHAVTNSVGCVDTFSQSVNIFLNPTCAISYVGNDTICSNDSLTLNACGGYLNYQWYKNGFAIPLATSTFYVANQTGNYTFVAKTPFGCEVTSDTVSLVVKQPTSTTFIQIGSTCEFSNFSVAIPSCNACIYNWTVDNIGYPSNQNSINDVAGNPPFTVGSHWVHVYVINDGCLTVDSIQITINPNPTVTITTTGPLPICSNNLYSFLATSAASSPSWNWILNNQTIGINNILSASSEGLYQVIVKDGITGCTALAQEIIQASPDLRLFPIGCDLICDTASLFLPIPSLNNNLSNYSSINWYDNAPPYTSPVGSGVSFPLNSLPNGNHNLSLIVMATNGCADTSTVYELTTYACIFPLGVQSIHLNAFEEKDKNMLQWKVKDENGVDNYNIEKSIDGVHFSTIGKVKFNGKTVAENMYSFEDLNPEIGENYYRIKIIDIDKKETYSNIALVKKQKTFVDEISIYPNPTKNQLFVEINVNGTKTIDYFKLMDLQGREIMAKYNFKKQVLNIDFLPNGIYYYSISYDEKILNGKINKTN